MVCSRTMRTYASQERGASTISYAILLPFFLLLLFGAYQLWKVVALRQGLNRATYLAARYISEAHPYPTSASALQRTAQEQIEAKLDEEGFFVQYFEGMRYRLRVVVDTDPARGHPVERPDGTNSILFEVRAEMEIPLLDLPPLPVTHLTLTSRHLGTFQHHDYDLKSKRPTDPETQGWHLSP